MMNSARSNRSNAKANLKRKTNRSPRSALGPKRSSATRRWSQGKELLFTEEGLNPPRNISGFKVHGEDFIEVLCGCTHSRLGDTVGKLTVSSDGQFMITCDCPRTHNIRRGTTESTDPTQMTPKQFECHAKDSANDWTKSIWVIINDEKVSLDASGLLDYYKERSNENNLVHRRPSFHRDEFLRCSKCNIERRFRLRTGDECRSFHDASANRSWNCSDHHDMTLECGKDEERTSRTSYRGCSSAPECQGCISCVCLGCKMCRFEDCGCRTCVDYIQNSET